ncbi:hypothetical protein H5410_001788, partial [Solanum commersonii]
VYHHLQRNKKFRSLIEVYNFFVYGDVRETKWILNQSKETLSLIKYYVVGTCTESCKEVYIKNRRDVHYLFEHDIVSNIGKKKLRKSQ